MGTFEDLNVAGLLSIGLQPEWTDIEAADYTGAPSSAADGIPLTTGSSLSASPVAYFSVDVREEVQRRTVYYQVTTADLTTTVYSVEINGNTVAYDASSSLPASATALIAGIAAAINADGTVGPLVTAIADPARPTTHVKITGDTEVDFTFDGSVAGGTGAIALSGDAASCKVRVFLMAGGIIRDGSTGSTRWKCPPGAGGIVAEWTADYRGLTDRLTVAGYSRIYVEIDDITKVTGDGTVTATIAHVMAGPAVLEATS